MRKKMLSLVLALIMVLALLPVSTVAANATVTQVIPFIYDDVDNFSEGLAVVKLGGMWSFIDKTGREVVPFKYDAVYHFSEGLAAVKLDGKFGFIDKAGKEVVSCQYDENADGFDSNGLF